MNKTGIEYGDMGWNFYPGCLHKPQGKCPVVRCWAEGMSKRKREDFHNPHLIPERLTDPLSRKKPTRILVNFMGDLFGDWVNPEMDLLPFFPCCDDEKLTLKQFVFDVIKHCPQHTFIFLTKNPERLALWSPFPDNCWVGVTACNYKMAEKAVHHLFDIKAKVKYLSLEPLMEDITTWHQPGLPCEWNDLEWVVIGAQTRPYRPPQIEWLRKAVAAADEYCLPVFLKDNLKQVIYDSGAYGDKSLVVKWNHGESEFDGLELFLRQEMPEV